MKDKEARQAINDLQLAVNVLIEVVLQGKKDNVRFLDSVMYDASPLVDGHRRGRFFD